MVVGFLVKIVQLLVGVRLGIVVMLVTVVHVNGEIKMKNLMKINRNNLMKQKELYAYEFQGCWWFNHGCLIIPYLGGYCLPDGDHDACNYCNCV